MLGHGTAVNRLLSNDPELLYAWDMYLMCRNQQLIIYEKPTGKKDGSKILSTVQWTTGLSVLPNSVGVGGENYLLMKYFHGFMQGEREGAGKLMSKKGKG